MKLVHKTIPSFVLAAALAMSAACTKNEAPTFSPGTPAAPSAASNKILVGEVGSMTGEQATFGTSTHEGVMLAVKLVNAAGGVNGRPLQLTENKLKSRRSTIKASRTRLPRR